MQHSNDGIDAGLEHTGDYVQFLVVVDSEIVIGILHLETATKHEPYA